MDGKFGYALHRGNETVSLFYPLGLRYFSRGSNVDTRTASRDDMEMALASSYVRLYGLTPDSVRKDDIEGEMRSAHGRVVLRHVTIRIPCTFNLYVSVPVENEPLNVEFVERTIARFMQERVLLLKSRNERRDRREGVRTDQARNQDFVLASPKLELVLENVGRSLSSLYDVFDVLNGLGAFESSGTDQLRDVGMTIDSNLYVCRFQDARLFSDVWRHLCENASHWSSVYCIPSSLDDECLRFCLDMLFEKRERELAEQETPTENSTGRRRRNFRTGAESSEELVGACPTLTEDVTAATILEDGADGAAHGLDLYDAFALGSWCLTRLSTAQSRLVVRIDRPIFDRICDSMTDLCAALAERGGLREKLFSTPLAFLPSVIWDIETIAARPGTLPRGTAADEAVVSVAVSVERNSLLPDGVPFSLSRVHSLTMLLLPRGAKCYPTALQSLHLLDESTTQPTVLCYRDERTMLLDFCAYMSSQTPLLRLLFNIRRERLAEYRNVASFLVGHNTVGYDFSFVVNRCIYYGLARLARHLTRNIRHDVGDVCSMFNFCDAQLCVDTLLFLMARVRSLSAFDLASVLRVYDCDIKKGGLDARAIRFFYNSIDDDEALARLELHTPARQIAYVRDLLVYNLYDCLSLSSFLMKMSFPVFVDTLLAYFRAPLDVACYCGNSRLLPALFISDLLRTGREVLCLRAPNIAVFSVDAQMSRLASLFRELHEVLAALGLSGSFLVHAFHGLDVDKSLTRIHDSLLSDDEPSAPKRRRVQHDPFTRMLISYVRTLEASVSVDHVSSSTSTPPTVRWVDLAQAVDEQTARSRVVAVESESELLRVHEKTYIGGLNYASACHVRNPVLMDYNSFYPSIIRHYELDVNNVAVVTVLKLLLIVRPLARLRELLAHKMLRLFDYTPEHSVEEYVNLSVFRSEQFSSVFQPAPYVRRDWYEGVELDNVELLIASSKLLSRRILVVWKKESGSAVSRLVTAALERRAVWKKLRRTSPNDKMLESRELMEKLLANGTYGYLNFKHSVIFSRATAAAVTLLCRNAFARTRFILESEELLRRFDPELAERFKVDVNYIDTDGCIVSLRSRQDQHQTVRFSTPGCESVRLSRSPLLFRETREKEDLEQYFDEASRSKDRFVELVNEMLGMRHVVLAAEEQNAVAATVFGRKKYALLKACPSRARNCADLFVLKKTGFEKNAPLPVKRVYDVLFKNVMLLNHTSGLLHSERFVCKIIDHRSIMYSIFDCLLAEWRHAVSQDALGSFSTRVPLNPRQTGGKLAEFIERTLREHQYNPGDRVNVLRLLRIDDRSLAALPRIHDSTGAPVVMYDPTDSEFVLLEEARGRISDYVLDVRLFLGGHLTYLYQCVEGQQTLRDGALETVAIDRSGAPLKMRTLRGIAMLFYSTWLWDRVLRHRHVEAFGADAVNFYAINWRGVDSPAQLTRVRRELMCADLQTLLADERGDALDKVFPSEQNHRTKDVAFTSPPPFLFHERFRDKWLHRENERVVRLALFSWEQDDRVRCAQYSELLDSDVLEYKSLDA